MEKDYVKRRLTELGIYNDYYYRRELRAVPGVLKEGEQINCVMTGVHEAERKMILITQSRIIVIFAPALGAANVFSIGLGAVTAHTFEKRFLFSTVTICADGKEYRFKAVQAARKALFEQAFSI